MKKDVHLLGGAMECVLRSNITVWSEDPIISLKNSDKRVVVGGGGLLSKNTSYFSKTERNSTLLASVSFQSLVIVLPVRV